MDIIKKKTNSKSEMYATMKQHIENIFHETFDLYAALSNTSALLALYLDHVNWAGFYIMKDIVENTKKQDVSLYKNQGGIHGEIPDENRKEIHGESLADNHRVIHGESPNEYERREIRKESVSDDGRGFIAEDGEINQGKRILVLGPFQGKPAVAHIEVGSGVCGTAVGSRRQQRVDDVRNCCNHIACDLATASEIVTPVFVDGEVWGVIDIDSPVPARFDAEDEKGMKGLAEVLGKMVESYSSRF